MPLAVLLLGSVLLKTSVAAPLKLEVTRAQTETMMAEQMESMPEADRREYEKAMAEAEASGDMTEEQLVDTALSITSVADVVFSALGAILAIIYIATFFFVAAKTWASPVKYTTMLTIASLSLLPHAIRNVIQTIYMGGSGILLQYPGLGALVAPADPMQPPGAAYALLSQIDLFVLWGLAILFGALVSKTAGIDKKRAISAMAVFVVITGLLQAVPTIIGGLFAGATM